MPAISFHTRACIRVCGPPASQVFQHCIANNCMSLAVCTVDNMCELAKTPALITRAAADIRTYQHSLPPCMSSDSGAYRRAPALCKAMSAFQTAPTTWSAKPLWLPSTIWAGPNRPPKTCA